MVLWCDVIASFVNLKGVLSFGKVDRDKNDFTPLKSTLLKIGINGKEHWKYTIEVTLNQIFFKFL